MACGFTIPALQPALEADLSSFHGREFTIDDSYMGLDSKFLSEAVGVECKGLLGADVLSAFDQIIDLPGGRLILSLDELEHSGERLELDEFMGIPIISVTVSGEPFRMFFDTGAQVSYLQDDLPTEPKL